MFEKKQVVGSDNDNNKRKMIKKMFLICIPILLVIIGVLVFTNTDLSKIMGNSVTTYECDDGYTLKEDKCVKEIKKQAYLIGDVDMDGSVTLADADLIRKYVDDIEFGDGKTVQLSEYQLRLADINKDDDVYYIDEEILKSKLSGNPGTYGNYASDIDEEKICEEGFELKNDFCVKEDIVSPKDNTISSKNNTIFSKDDDSVGNNDDSNPVDITFLSKDNKTEVSVNEKYDLSVKFNVKNKNNTYYYQWRDYNYGQVQTTGKCMKVVDGTHYGNFYMNGTKKISVTIYSDSQCQNVIQTKESKEYKCVGCTNMVDASFRPENNKIIVEKDSIYNINVKFDVKDKNNTYYYIWRNYLNGDNNYKTGCTKIQPGEHKGSFKVNGYRRAVVTIYSDSSCKNAIKSVQSKLYMYSGIISGKQIPMTQRLKLDSNYGLQGVCLTDKYIIAFKMHGVNSEKKQLSDLYIIGKDDFKVKKIKNNNLFGHANDCTFNPNTKEITVVTSEGNKAPAIKRFKIDDKYNLTNMTEFYLDSTTKKLYMNGKNVSGNTFKNLPGITSIAYDKDHNQYIVYAGRTVYITNLNYVVEKSFSVPSYLIAQGIAYRNNKIYITLFESGSSLQQNNPTPSEAGSNVVYIYDMNGNFENALYIPKSKILPNDKNKKSLPEIESMDFYPDGTMLFGFTHHINGPKSLMFYTSKSQ